jgi:OOP family OmpA-OmpF porin
MIHALNLKQAGFAVSCALALAALSGTATAQALSAAPGYLVSTDGPVVTSGTGLCVHAGTGDPPAAWHCDPVVVSSADPSPAAAAPQAAVVEAPAVVAAASPPDAPPPDAPLPPAASRVTLDADALFDFDQSVLRSDGQLALDDFAGKVKDMHAQMFTVYGYTDRLGTDEYNQGLSERRVDTVKSYLVAKGVDSTNMHAEGKGNSDPITKAGECDGAENARVIACLQPDRRVEIEVTGTAAVM